VSSEVSLASLTSMLSIRASTCEVGVLEGLWAEG
jgi:hypothetical protein